MRGVAWKVGVFVTRGLAGVGLAIDVRSLLTGSLAESGAIGTGRTGVAVAGSLVAGAVADGSGEVAGLSDCVVIGLGASDTWL